MAPRSSFVFQWAYGDTPLISAGPVPSPTRTSHRCPLSSPMPRQANQWVRIPSDLRPKFPPVLRRYSSGNRQMLLGISRRRDQHLRTLLVHGARAVVRVAARRADPFSRWVNVLRERRGVNRAIVAVAKKTLVSYGRCCEMMRNTNLPFEVGMRVARKSKKCDRPA